MKVLKQKDDKQTVTRPCGGCGADRSSQQQNLGPDSRPHSYTRRNAKFSLSRSSCRVQSVQRTDNQRETKLVLDWTRSVLESLNFIATQLYISIFQSNSLKLVFISCGPLHCLTWLKGKIWTTINLQSQMRTHTMVCLNMCKTMLHLHHVTIFWGLVIIYVCRRMSFNPLRYFNDIVTFNCTTKISVHTFALPFLCLWCPIQPNK